MPQNGLLFHHEFFHFLLFFLFLFLVLIINFLDLKYYEQSV